MGKFKFLKWLAPLGIGAVIMGSEINFNPTIFARAETSIVTPEYRINASKVTLNNSALAQAIRNLLGKEGSNEVLYSDAFVNHDRFKPDAENPIYQLDFSGTGITDIRELAQFEIPSHIQGINLAGNGITTESLNNISAVLSLAKDETIVLGDRTITSATDFSTQIMKVNLNDNDIDLQNIDTSHLENTKFLFGVQNIGEIDNSGFVRAGEINPMYYIRSTDESYLTYTFTNALYPVENGILPKTRNAVTPVLLHNQNDKYTISVASVPDSSTAYFKGYSMSAEFTQFTLSLDEDFTVERNNGLLDLKVGSDGKLLEGSPINIDGFGDNSTLHIYHNSPSISTATSNKNKNEVDITLTKDGKSRTITLEFKVVDTVKPVIVLKGSAHAYSSKNKHYNDPGATAYDPSVVGAETGDPLNSLIVVDNNVDVTTLGEYTITYTVTDFAGNTSSITRIVEIQEQVLDTITLRTNTTEPVHGDDIILIVQPSTEVDITKYKDIKYYWYINDVLFQTTVGDSVSGKSTITLVGDSSKTYDIYVKLKATQISDNADIEVYSDSLTLNVESSAMGDNTIIIAVAIAVTIILLTIVSYGLIKYYNRKKKTHGKHKNFHKGKKGKVEETIEKPKGPEIQVIKDYKGDPQNPPQTYNTQTNTDNNNNDK